MSKTDLLYCTAGGNRHPSAADWAPGLLAFGAGNNLALWNPEDPSHRGISALLSGHTDVINAVKIFDAPKGRRIITGSADYTIRIWTLSDDGSSYEQGQCLQDHEGSVNVITVLPSCGMFVSGSADGTVKVWRVVVDGIKLHQTVSLKPRYLPLTCALVVLDNGAIVLAVAGTSASIQVFSTDDSRMFQLRATLTGHEGWIRSLDFGRERDSEGSDILLASASQDKFIRLWRVKESSSSPPLANALSNKTHTIGVSGTTSYNVSFEALLVGHEDWVYTLRWAPQGSYSGHATLLSASADNSLSIWRADESANVWVCQTQLGDISSQKGSTTATGSTGGFWIGLWQPDGKGVVSLGRTGSWRRWSYSSSDDTWLQNIGISGHIQDVQSCSWAPDGSYLLSTGSDQTTRMFGEWRLEDSSSWHELSRPQIHGYDLNCIASLTRNQFVSGADEKLLRVFNKPRAVDQLFSKLSGTKAAVNGELPDAANIPVLGLSNKAVVPTTDDDIATSIVENGGYGEDEVSNVTPTARTVALDLDHPPFEEHLARHTLWPEHEKLYGHGYEMSAVASANDGSLIATACKASSIDHAVIRLYECREWREIKPPLTVHSLTVTSLDFSPSDKYLLSVSRDRGLCVFERDAMDAHVYKNHAFNAKAHSRMILDCSWAPAELGDVFATAGRDKTVKIWRLIDGQIELVHSIAADSSVTAVAFHDQSSQEVVKIAYGTEHGDIMIVELRTDGLKIASTTMVKKTIVPSASINALRWRPSYSDHRTGQGNDRDLLAAASDDTSLRVFSHGPD